MGLERIAVFWGGVVRGPFLGGKCPRLMYMDAMRSASPQVLSGWIPVELRKVSSGND